MVLLLFFLPFLAAASPLERIEGTVRLAAGPAFMMETAAGPIPVFLQPHTILEGVGAALQIIPGDAIRVEVERRQGALVWAARIGVAPPPSLEDRRMIDPAEMERLATEKGEAGFSVVDCRPPAAFARGHIAGAVSRDSADGAAAFRDKGRAVVLVGEDRYNREALEAFQELMRSGHAGVRVLAGGMEGWNLSGRPTAVEPSGIPSPPPPSWELLLVDVRDPEDYARGHLPGAFSAPLRTMDWGRFSRLSGMPPMVFCGGGPEDLRPAEAARQVLDWRFQKAINLNGAVGVLSGGVRAWKSAGLPIAAGPPAMEFTPEAVRRPWEVSVEEWMEMADSGEALLVDLRKKDNARPAGALHLPLEELAARLEELPRNRPLVLFCSIGVRARVGAEILRLMGYQARYFPEEPPF